MAQPDAQENPKPSRSPGGLLFVQLLIRNLPGWIYYRFGQYPKGVLSCCRVIAKYPNPGCLNIRGLC